MFFFLYICFFFVERGRSLSERRGRLVRGSGPLYLGLGSLGKQDSPRKAFIFIQKTFFSKKSLFFCQNFSNRGDGRLLPGATAQPGDSQRPVCLSVWGKGGP